MFGETVKTYRVTGMTYSYSLGAWEVTSLDRRFRSKVVEAEDATAAAYLAVGFEAVEAVGDVRVYAGGTRYLVEEES